jgi:hypothetical protein
MTVFITKKPDMCQILCAQKGSKFMSKKTRIRKIEQLETGFAEVPCARGANSKSQNFYLYL